MFTCDKPLVHTWIFLRVELQEALLERHVKRSNLASRFTSLLKVVHSAPTCYPIGTTARIVVVVTVDA